MTINNWYSGTANRIEAFQAGDARLDSVDGADAMASAAASSDGGLTRSPSVLALEPHRIHTSVFHNFVTPRIRLLSITFCFKGFNRSNVALQ